MERSERAVQMFESFVHDVFHRDQYRAWCRVCDFEAMVRSEDAAFEVVTIDDSEAIVRYEDIHQTDT